MLNRSSKEEKSEEKKVSWEKEVELWKEKISVDLNSDRTFRLLISSGALD